MTVSRPVKILVGLATLWYGVYLLLTLLGLLLFLGVVVLAVFTGGEAISTLRTLLMQILALEFMIPIHVCSLSLEVGLLIFYLIHTIRNTRASDAMRVALGLGHIFLPFAAMPIYYYLYIWRESPPEWAASLPGKTAQVATETVL